MSKERHRGPAPKDDALFGLEQQPILRRAVEELSWLRSRGYAPDASLKLVGDRHALTARQRKAVDRSVCTDGERARRRARALGLDELRGREVWLDGFNCLIVCESLLSGAPVFVGRDGAVRDIASVHGTWKRVSETRRALEALGEVLAEAAPARTRWLLDRPVSNSGRLRGLILETAEAHGWTHEVELLDAPDAALATPGHVAATGDAWILDRADAWTDLPAAVLVRMDTPPWAVDLRPAGDHGR